MAITKLTVENFKSFDKLEVELRPFNIVVGTNASGKSNFLDVFRFLRDIEASSLEDATGIRGGADALRNISLDDNRVLRISVDTDDVQGHLSHATSGSTFGIKIERTTYELAIRFDESDEGFEVVTDRLTEQFNVVELDSSYGSGSHFWSPVLPWLSTPPAGLYAEQRVLGTGQRLNYRKGDLIEFRIKELSEEVRSMEEPFSLNLGVSFPTGRHQVMLQRIYRTALVEGAAGSLASTSAYDFDPRKAQQAVPPTGSRKLDASAENLAVVLREICRRPESKKRLISLVSVLLPFVHDLDVEEFGFGQLITTLTERFSDKGHRLPSAFASDGTIACLALVVALYFQESAVAVFEEPDRHVHPHLASRVMQMMNEVTDDTQVIVTTHNPELLRHANLEDILLVTRDPDGHSQITRPADSEVVRQFLQSELGVEDLFAQNLLDL